MSRHASWVLGLLVGALWLSPLRGEPPAAPAKAEAAWQKPAPADVQDLRQIETHLHDLLPTVQAATVHLELRSIRGSVNGSGVIISQEGYILTAAHVSSPAGRDVIVTFPSGRQVRGKTLGWYKEADAGLVKITEKGEWPMVPMGRSSTLKPGTWCFALGYPGGYDKDRGPVLRIGHVRRADPKTLWTDCILLGGDSGGPLFDMNGRVIGIHSRIAKPLEFNYHVAIDAFHASWEALAAGKQWKLEPSPAPSTIADLLGVDTSPSPLGALVVKLNPDSPAAHADMKAGDVIVGLNQQIIVNPQMLDALLQRHKPDDKVKLRLMRGPRELEIEVTLGAQKIQQPSSP